MNNEFTFLQMSWFFSSFPNQKGTFTLSDHPPRGVIANRT